MNRESILSDVRKEIVKLGSVLDYDNLNESSTKIKKYLDLLRLVQDLPFEVSLREANDNIVEIQNNKMVEIYDIKNNLYVGQVKLKLHGGELGSFKIFVPEKVIRELDCSDGDWLRASVVYSKRLPNGVVKNRYQFTLVQKTDIKIENERREIKYAYVEYDDTLNLFYIQNGYQDSLPLRIMIPSRDAEIFDLKSGDLVDYAYWEENILGGKVIWKHEVDFYITPPPKINRSKNSNMKVDINNEIVREEKIVPIFKDKQIIVVGFDTMKNIYKDEIEKRGGTFKFLTGDEKVNSIESIIRESDIVIMFIDFVGHGGMNKVRNISKQCNISITYTKKMGKEAFVKLVKEILKEDLLNELIPDESSI